MPRGVYPRVVHDWYKLVKVPNHPRASLAGYVKRPVLVMEAHLGRYLLPNEEVHHLNKDKTDDRIENLFLTTHAEHAKIHGFYEYNHKPRNTKGRPFYGNGFINADGTRK